ncbi:PQQ-binding-like beta-propeller repeat protein [Pirellulales bacterium]|nr:PQQ-binding-like beta-propeller repeat protein [Pirellulales bacterium]
MSSQLAGKSVRSKGPLIAAALFVGGGIIVWQIVRERSHLPRNHRQNVEPTLQGRDAGYWLTQITSSDRTARRAAQLTLRSAGPDAIPVLGYILQSDSKLTRQQAEQLLSATGAPGTPAIISLLEDKNPYVRMHAARVLASLQADSPNAIQALSAKLGDAEEGVVLDAAYALASLGKRSAPAVAALTKTLQHRHPLIRMTSAEALAAVGSSASDAVPDLIRLLEDDDAGVRRAGAQAIGQIGPPAGLAAVDRMIELLVTDEPYVRMAAATALGRIGPAAKSALPTLEDLQDDPTVGAEAAWAIARLTGDPLGSEAAGVRIGSRSPSAADRGGGPEFPALVAASVRNASSQDWPMLAGRPDRNAVTSGNPPIDWNLERGENVLWQVPLGRINFAGPAVANGRVFIGADNGAKRDPAHTDPQGVLAAFSAIDGSFLWQDLAPYRDDRGLSHTLQEYTTSTPLIEGDRLYYVTAQAQIRCLDVEAFADSENDGPWTAEISTGPHDADLIWEIDMGVELGVYPHEAPNCSIVSVGDLLMVGTSNGVDVAHTNMPAPRAPSFLGVDRESGRVVWQVTGPSPRVLHGQWCSPSLGQVGDRTIVFFGGGDGWLYALDPFTGRELWRYDGNPKDAIWRPASDSGKAVFRNNIIACPVFHEGHVLLAMGQDPTHGDGQGLLHRIRCDGIGDVTTSHNIWKNQDVHRTIATPIVQDGLVYVGDNFGEVHCLDQETGEQVWVHDQMARIWGCMLLVGDALYVGDEDGRLTIYRASREKQVLGQIEMGSPIYAMPAICGDTLFVATANRLYAVEQRAGNP